MKYSAIIFDMDGTIVDTENIWMEATRQLIVHYGIEYTQEVHGSIREQVQGMGLHNVCYLIKETFDLSVELNELIEHKISLANNLYTQEISYINGFTDFIALVKDQFTKNLAIATNADNNTIRATNAQLDLAHHFGKHIYGIESVNNRAKPEPDIYLYAAHKINVDPSKCIAIEDSAHGINAAKAAGMFCIGINSAGNKKLLKNADIIIDTYGELDINQFIK